MKPDRYNYEIWLIDLIDGALDKTETDKILKFLEENPDIKEEAESLMFSRLSPYQYPMPDKHEMKRSLNDLTPSQFEFLSVAYLENDLNPDQIEEIKQYLTEKPDDRIIFETLQKIKLVPPELNYINKNRLKRRTLGDRISSISLAALSAAAAIAILVISILAISDNVKEQQVIIAENNMKDISPAEAVILIPHTLHDPHYESVENKVPEIKPAKETLMSGDVSFENHLVSENNPEIIFKLQAENDPLISEISTENIKISLSKGLTTNTLIAPLTRFLPAETIEDDRSRLNKFLARTFREKILKKDGFSEEPVRSFELAQAGIGGLNKLMGWEIALVKTTDTEGETRSVYFSSRLLKFNIPVKKEDTGQ